MHASFWQFWRVFLPNEWQAWQFTWHSFQKSKRNIVPQRGKMIKTAKTKERKKIGLGSKKDQILSCGHAPITNLPFILPQNVYFLVAN